MPGPHRLPPLEVDLDQLLARRNTRDDLLGSRIDHYSAIGIHEAPIDAERDPAGM